MSSFLGSFASEFRPLKLDQKRYEKDDLGQTVTRDYLTIDFQGILFAKGEAQNFRLGGNLQGNIGPTYMSSDYVLYAELGLDIRKGDVVIDDNKRLYVRDVVTIYVFGGVKDHQKAFLSLSE